MTESREENKLICVFLGEAVTLKIHNKNTFDFMRVSPALEVRGGFVLTINLNKFKYN